MPRKFSPQVVTANRLLEGDAVWFTASHDWSAQIEDAAIAQTPEEADTLLDAANKQHHLVVGPYLADTLEDEDGKAGAVHFREAFRTRGPSNYFHGKQAHAAKEQPANTKAA